MDLERRLDLISGVGEEVITRDELRTLLETKDHPIAYDGFEPSGLAHLPVGVYRPLLLKDMIEAGVQFKLLMADSFAWINNKFDGDLDRIRVAGEYFMEVWKAAGVDTKKIETVWHKDFFDDPEYWKKVILVAKNHSITRTMRSLAIAGRGEDVSQPTAFVFYPSMQCADIFHLDADICQLGMDQRKVNMLARDITSKKGMSAALGYADKGATGKPVIVSHHMLIGLQGLQGKVEDSKAKVQAAIDAKMSKSKPTSAIFVHDTKKQIRKKIGSAFCPMEEVEGNPIMDYAKEIVFRSFDSFEIERPEKWGGNLHYESYDALVKDYSSGQLHPQDLKMGVAEYLDRLIEPIRSHFEKGKAKKLYETVNSYKVTR